MMNKKIPTGFNLAGLIVSIGVFLILSASLWVAIDPSARINRAKDTRREQDVLILAQALKDYVRHHQGSLPFVGDISNRKRVLCSNTARLTCGDDADACLEIDTTTDFFSSYLPSLPIDPGKTNSTDTGYYIEGNPSTGQISIGACDYSVTEVVYQPLIKASVLDCGEDGIAYNGVCWYLSQTVSAKDCDWFCATDYSKTCDNTVTPTINSCELNSLFAGVQCGSCVDTSVSDFAYSPGVGSSLTTCFEDSDVNVCAGVTVSDKNFPICPCI